MTIGREFSVAFAVSDESLEAGRGDLYTALELGRELVAQNGWRVDYVSEDAPNDAFREFDVVVAMTHNFKPWLASVRGEPVYVAWCRNWFSEWVRHPSLHRYDVIFSSSRKGSSYIREMTGRRAVELPLATNPQRFMPAKGEGKPELDIVFTGNYWGWPRRITETIVKLSERFSVGVYGCGWDQLEAVQPIWKGFVPYYELPEIYRNARIVVDDTNHTALPWGSLNSRVYDALASGCMVVTDNAEGVEEIFKGLVPSFEEEDVFLLVERLLGAESERTSLSGRLRQTVLERHTYAHRARVFTERIISAKRLRPTITVSRRAGLGGWVRTRLACHVSGLLGYRSRIVCEESASLAYWEISEAIPSLTWRWGWHFLRRVFRKKSMLPVPDTSLVALIENKRVACEIAGDST